jgi:hypothetical protein
MALSAARHSAAKPGSSRHHASRLFSSIISSSVIGRYSHTPDFQRRILPKCDCHSPLRSSFRTKAIHKARMSKTAALMKIKLHGLLMRGSLAAAKPAPRDRPRPSPAAGWDIAAKANEQNQESAFLPPTSAVRPGAIRQKMRREFLQRGGDSGAVMRKLRQKVSAGIFGNIDFPIAHMREHLAQDRACRTIRRSLGRASTYPLVEVDHLAPINPSIGIPDRVANCPAEVRADVPPIPVRQILQRESAAVFAQLARRRTDAIDQHHREARIPIDAAFPITKPACRFSAPGHGA